jgi:hypothetical protein
MPRPSLIGMNIAETGVHGISTILTSSRLLAVLPRSSFALHSSCFPGHAFMTDGPGGGSGELVGCGFRQPQNDASPTPAGPLVSVEKFL